MTSPAAPPPILPGAHNIAHALMIATNPAIYAHRTTARIHAWAVLMGARGRYVHHHRLVAMARTENHRNLRFWTPDGAA